MISGRYPYTYAYDHLRIKTDVGISRADMAQIVSEIAKVLEVPKEVVAERLADRYLEENGISKEGVDD